MAEGSIIFSSLVFSFHFVTRNEQLSHHQLNGGHIFCEGEMFFLFQPCLDYFFLQTSKTNKVYFIIDVLDGCNWLPARRRASTNPGHLGKVRELIIVRHRSHMRVNCIRGTRKPVLVWDKRTQRLVVFGVDGAKEILNFSKERNASLKNLVHIWREKIWNLEK